LHIAAPRAKQRAMTTLKLDQFLPYRLSIASNAVSEAVASSYRAMFGLRIPEWRLIAVLAEDGAMSQQALCGRTRMDKVTVSRAAIALADRHLVERTPNPEDQRSHLLGLTGEGWELYERIAPQALELERRIFDGIAPAEIEALRTMLARLEAATVALEP
jgi:DNA-binding MarR family transcriptional regulator